MNLSRFNKQIFLNFYLAHKEYIISYTVIAVSILVFALIIPNQIKNIFLSKQKSEETDKRVKVLSNNFDFLSSLGDATLDSDLQLVSFALPDGKDFETILRGISQAGAAAGVQVGDFGLDIGDLSQKDIKANSLSSLTMQLSINGGINGVIKFIQELSNLFPLSEVQEVQSVAGSSRVSVSFFFKPFPPAKLEVNNPIKPLSQEEIDLLKQLSFLSRGQVSQAVVLEENTSSSSAGF